MKNKKIIIKEYINTLQLSDECISFLENHPGTPIPENIRKELEQYLVEIEPEVLMAQDRLDKLMSRVFNK
jgi:hypothetical protein